VKLWFGRRCTIALVEDQQMKAVLTLGLLVAFTAPAFAQSTTVQTTTSGGPGFYIVQDVKTKRCTVTREKPTGSSMTIVSGNSVYKTETEAQSAVKTTKVCTTN
jgi:hypothetical protein